MTEMRTAVDRMRERAERAEREEARLTGELERAERERDALIEETHRWKAAERATEERARQLERERDEARRLRGCARTDAIAAARRDAMARKRVKQAERECDEARAKLERVREAAQSARHYVDVAMGDTDPIDPEDPLLLACQLLSAALDDEQEGGS